MDGCMYECLHKHQHSCNCKLYHSYTNIFPLCLSGLFNNKWYTECEDKGRTTDMWHSIARTNKKFKTRITIEKVENEIRDNDGEEYHNDSDYYIESESDSSNESFTQVVESKDRSTGELRNNSDSRNDNFIFQKQGEKIT